MTNEIQKQHTQNTPSLDRFEICKTFINSKPLGKKFSNFQ